MKRRGHFFKGQMAVVMTFAIATLLGAMALGTDVAVMYFNWVQLQKGADAAALAGAFYLTPANSTQYPIDSVAVAAAGCGGQPDDARKTACMYAAKNKMAVDAASLKIYEPAQNLPVTAPKPNIQVWVKRSNLPYFFGKVRERGSQEADHSRYLTRASTSARRRSKKRRAGPALTMTSAARYASAASLQRPSRRNRSARAAHIS